ncbi:MAG TPA: dolichyl-phosphate beta-glucosyltransferase [Thermoguttaceae bacterium]|nr:dolichyl-phosphate beta-glucosyltransferase [Thermoguttaceae bacterium]
MGIALSVIIPAFNEALRLPPFLQSVRKYLDRQHQDAYEVIVVNDGSRDGMADVLSAMATEWPALVVIEHPANRGKGAAVRTGMLAARGELLLFADADGATPIDQEARLADAIHGGADLAVGSRLVDATEVTRRRTWTRGLVGRLFASVAKRWLGLSVQDTQCGFKMFSAKAGRELFASGHETGYLFDLELLVLAAQLGYEVAEVPVNWKDVPGSHLSMARDSGKILVGLWRIRRRMANRP